MLKTSDVSQKKNSKSDQKEKKSLIGEIIEWIKIIVIALVVALFINNFIITNSYIPTPSMESNLPVGSRLFGFRLNYLFSKPKRGDVVIFDYGFECKNKNTPLHGSPYMYQKNAEGKCPRCGTESNGCTKVHYIKRVIGLPGDTVEIKQDEEHKMVEIERFKTDKTQSILKNMYSTNSAPCGHVYINGEKLEEDYLNEPMIVMEDERFKGIKKIKVPDDCYFLLGDNRNDSEDARYWKNTFINIKDIEAKAYLLYWPLNRFGFIRGGEYDKKE